MNKPVVLLSHEASNVVFLAPGTGKTHLSIALGAAAARRRDRVALATAHEWVNPLAPPTAQEEGTGSA